ncbi:MAG: hypothetical protein WAU07_01045, partial [Microgenomates group bacterium]
HDRNKTYLQSATQHLKDGNALNCAELVDRYLTQRVEILLLMQRAQDAQKNQDALRPKITALFKDKLHFDSHAQLLNIGNLNLSLVINFLDLSSPTVSYAHVEFDNYDFHMKELEKFIDVLFAILTQRDLLESSAMYQDRDRSHNAVATLHQLSEVLIKDAFGYATMREWNSANVMLKELSVYMQHIENAPKIDAESRFVVSEEIQSLATNLERMWAQTEDLSKKRSDKNDDTEFTRKITTLLEELSGVDSIIVVLQGALDSGEVARYSLQSQLIKAKHELQLLQLRISSLEMEYSQETVAQEQTYVFYGPSKNALEERDATVRSKQSALTLLLTESETIQLSDEIYERVAGFQEKVHSTRVRSIRFLSGYGEATNGELNILLAEYDSLILNEFESIKNQLVIAREAHEKLVKNAQSQYATVINKRNMIEAALHRFSITPTVEEMFRRACELLVRQPELLDTPPEIVASLKNLELLKTLFDTVASLMPTELQALDKQIMTHKQTAEAQRAKILKRPDADEKRRMALALELAKQFRINSVNLYVSE